MPTILIAPIGTTDVQIVVNSKKYRCPLGKIEHLESIPHKFPLLWKVNCPEQEPDTINLRLATAITFPKLRTAIDHLVKKKVSCIDQLVLIATDRTKPIQSLETLIPQITSDKLKETAQNNKERAKNDPSMLSARIMKTMLGEYAEDLPIKIAKITILGLGSGPYFDSLPPLPQNLTRESLDRFDINKADFLDFELIHALKPYLAELQSSRLFVCSWGGFQNLHKSLHKVLSSLLLYPKIEHIYGDANTGSLTQALRQDDFLELHQIMHRAALEMDWIVVAQVFQDMIKLKPSYFHDKTSDRLRELISTIEQQQKIPANWFSNFFVLIMKALYTQDYNSLFIWLKCMEEASFLAILELPENSRRLSYSLKKNVPLATYIPSQKGKGSVLIFKDGRAILAKFSEVWTCFGAKKSMTYLEEYGNLLYQKLNKPQSLYKPNTHLMRIIDRRNGLVHNGRPIQRDSALIISLMGFLGISQKSHKQAVIALKSSDWESLIKFELEVLTKSKLFSLLKSIAGITDPDWLPLERTSLHAYRNIVHHKEE
ncbi:MAG: hypothetical protein PHU99_09880 [Candidatus Cloacimonetes bacterium]|nr:hypothetical protein [Candidatus Cloacimonadota bacterium]MDD3578185.1 hypothetical protein [Candidatus Cloacimonadota bacterium]MDD4668005.1 hypothetical protein [Candidatus Cloacimonadota bacterium]HPF08751.1 hypothetical protein [Candidatus Cloacimonadota bacterium]